MKKSAIAIFMFLMSGCDVKENITYKELPCKASLDLFMRDIDFSIDKVSAFNNDSSARVFLKLIYDRFYPYRDTLFKCVWDTHEENRDAYSDKHRELIMTFSDSLSTILASSGAALDEEEVTQINIELLEWSLNNVSKELNNSIN